MLDVPRVLSQKLTEGDPYFSGPSDFVDMAFPGWRDGTISGTLDDFRRWAACSKIFVAEFGSDAFLKMVAALSFDDRVHRFLQNCGTLDFDLEVGKIIDRLLPLGGTAAIVGADRLDGVDDRYSISFFESDVWKKHVFEPSPIALAHLRSVCNAHPHTQIYPWAITQERGWVDFFLCKEQSCLSTLSMTMVKRREENWDFEKISIMGIDFASLPEVAGIAEIDLLFSDTEGADCNVVTACLDAYRPKVIFFEWVHLCHLVASSTSVYEDALSEFDRLIETLRANEYRINLIDPYNALAVSASWAAG